MAATEEIQFSGEVKEPVKTPAKSVVFTEIAEPEVDEFRENVLTNKIKNAIINQKI